VRVKKFDSMNVVPFIDIMLVLLVIVLTTATFVARGIIPVDLSEGKSSSKITKDKTLTITIKENGDIFFNKDNIDKNQILSKLNEFKKDTSISINCDKNAKFDNFVTVVDILKQKEYNNLGIITKYE
jgi:biopolymer transport protein ExbD